MKFVIVGGPWDGTIVRTSMRPEWAWIDADGRVWRQSRPGRKLHRLTTAFDQGGRVYLYAGNHALCRSCGCYHRVPDGKLRSEAACSLCGGALAAG